MTARVLLILSVIAAIAAMTLPGGDFTGRPDWGKAEWMPFHDPTISVSDILMNVALFLPFGFFLWRVRGGALWKILLLAAAFSFCGEFYQIFCVHRHPDSTDVLADSTGALLGAVVASRTKQRLAEPPPEKV